MPQVVCCPQEVDKAGDMTHHVSESPKVIHEQLEQSKRRHPSAQGQRLTGKRGIVRRR
jgi:hypothetical protein